MGEESTLDQLFERDVVLLQSCLEADLVDRSDGLGRELEANHSVLLGDEDPLALDVRLEDVLAFVVSVADAMASLARLS